MNINLTYGEIKALQEIITRDIQYYTIVRFDNPMTTGELSTCDKHRLELLYQIEEKLEEDK